MAVGTTQVTIVGNLTADPELRFTQAGKAVANFTVASTEKKYNRQSNQWEDGDALFMRCNIWNEYAENVAESLTKGLRVVVVGDLKSRQYETKEGEKRTVWEVEVTEVGPALRYASAKVTKSQRGQQGGGQQGGWNQQPQGGAPQGNWGAPPQGQQNQWPGSPQPQPQPQQGGWGQQQPAWGGSAGDPPF